MTDDQLASLDLGKSLRIGERPRKISRGPGCSHGGVVSVLVPMLGRGPYASQRGEAAADAASASFNQAIS